MRIMFVLATTAITSLPFAAQAAVSDDLVFCSKLTSPRERIACYDAAARIAANAPAATAPSRVPAPSILSAPIAGQPVPYKVPPAERTPFHGAYVGVGGAYGLGSPVNLSTFDGIQQLYSVTGSPHGPSVVGSVGYNIQYGHLVMGLELSGRYGRERFSDSGPVFTGSGGEFGVIGTSSPSSGFNVDASLHASTRAGLAFGDTLAFVKAGAGMAHTNEFARSDVKATRCDFGVFVGNTFVCGQRSVLPSIVNENSAWLPSVLFGLGIEHNFGPVFGRIEIEAEGVSRFNQTLDWYRTARAMAAVGVRF
jgi:hypothetical protein